MMGKASALLSSIRRTHQWHTHGPVHSVRASSFLCNTLPFSISKKDMTTTTTSNDDNIAYVFPPPPQPRVPVWNNTTATTSSWFPVHRIYCVGRNYASHAIEMGGDPSREPPFFFGKPATAIVPTTTTTTTTTATTTNDQKQPTRIPYPLATTDLHHEIELVIAIGKGGVNLSTQQADAHVYGYAVGVDLTRRDLQAAAKKSSRPWDAAKGFDQSAPISAILPKEACRELVQRLERRNDASSSNPPNNNNNIWLTVNGEMRQQGTLDMMTWTVPEIVSLLSQQFQLQPGDLIFSGTPAGVGPLVDGDHVKGGVDGLETEVEFYLSSS